MKKQATQTRSAQSPVKQSYIELHESFVSFVLDYYFEIQMVALMNRPMGEHVAEKNSIYALPAKIVEFPKIRVAAIAGKRSTEESSLAD